MRFQLVSVLVIGLIMSASAVPEIEHDLTEVNMKDCRVFLKDECIRVCPQGYSAVFRAQCFTPEDSHQCCAIRCCRSIHTEDDDEDELLENAPINSPIKTPYSQPSLQSATGGPLGARSRSGFRK